MSIIQLLACYFLIRAFFTISIYEDGRVSASVLKLNFITDPRLRWDSISIADQALRHFISIYACWYMLTNS